MGVFLEAGWFSNNTRRLLLLSENYVTNRLPILIPVFGFQRYPSTLTILQIQSKLDGEVRNHVEYHHPTKQCGIYAENHDQTDDGLGPKVHHSEVEEDFRPMLYPELPIKVLRPEVVDSCPNHFSFVVSRQIRSSGYLCSLLLALKLVNVSNCNRPQ